MDTTRFLIKSFGRRPLLIILASVLLLVTGLSEVAPSQANDKEKIVRQVAQKWIQVGMEQYTRGFYKAAEQSFLRAKDYQEYLATAERKKLKELLEKTHAAVLERNRILEAIRTANELVEQGRLMEAKVHLEKVKGNEFLTEKELEQIGESLRKLDIQLNERKKGIAEIAAEPEEKLPETAAAAVEDELLRVELKAARDTEQQVIQEAERPEVVEAPEPVTDEGGYIEVINRRRNILRSHTRAVVNDAVAKVQSYVSQGEFDKAKEAVETAERMVNKNQLYLGDDLFKQYSSGLKELAEKVIQGRNEQAQQLQEQRRVEAIKAQRRYREQMEADRSKRIAELMDNATAYQKQQRYAEALGQLENLLAIDPLNEQALILKDTLEDMISFRSQLELQKESAKERLGALMDTDKSMIPYASAFPTYPKNWREIAAKRKPEEAIGRSAVDAAVDRQLEQIVNLTELTPEMPLGEAIEELKNSVEPALKVFVNWRDLYDNADIDQTTPINMDPISAVPLGTVLELLLEVVSGGFAELGYIIEDGVITIATVESLPSKLETLVYDVTDLLGRPADYYAVSGGDVSVSGGAETAGAEGFEESEELDRTELEGMTAARAESLIMLIQETVEPDSWYDVGGEGSITVYGVKKLIVHQTREIHNKIQKLLNELRKALGYQVAIEARFLLVTENFLEDIGLDVDFDYQPAGNKLGLFQFRQNSATHTLPQSTGLPGSWGGIGEPTPDGVLRPLALAAELIGGYGAVGILTDLEVHFLLRSTQAHRDATSLTAPRVSVVSGESATMRVQRVTRYPSDIEIDIDEIGDQGEFRFNVDYEEGIIVTGSLLNITPTIMHDKKHVLLNVVTEQREFLGFTSNPIQLPIIGPGEGGGSYFVPLPETEISRVETRVSVPDGATLLLGGQKISVEVEREAGVPILAKIPLIGRLFANRSKVKDEKILLILIKPTIILQEETEAEAVAAMGSVS